MVDWLHRNVEGFTDRREARKYAGNLLKAGYIRHTVSKVTFSEQCYYVFGDLCAGEHCPPSHLDQPIIVEQSGWRPVCSSKHSTGTFCVMRQEGFGLIVVDDQLTIVNNQLTIIGR